MKIFIFSLLALGFISCASHTSKSSDVSELVAHMSGSFSSEQQSIQDSSYYHITLEMHPIWKNDKQYHWLYVEQAVADYRDKPYRQRVYRVSALPNGTFESRVYELPNPEKYIYGWKNPGVFKELTPDDLILREGCAVYLSKDQNGCYVGATLENQCASNLRGASYATSEVSICKQQIQSWDKGFDTEGNQVWGAVKGGYVFDKILKP